uniref:Protein kinase domain-containing protein n=1 Tax=Caenorhabditis tropicalis TaxID=1561998 RepID=A0A1I7TL02_9PELO
MQALCAAFNPNFMRLYLAQCSSYQKVKGSADERYFLVLDFGLARQYVTDEQDGKKMRRPREKALFRGTVRYCSVAMHDRFEQGRVDDLWMLVYMLAELRARLPWHDVDDKVEIGEMKRMISDPELFAKSPVQMLEFLRTVRNTQFYHRPDYEKLFKILDDVMKTAEYKWSDPYHWEPEVKKKKPHSGLVRLSRNKITTPTKESAETPDAPFFTLDDFTSNPIGF